MEIKLATELIKRWRKHSFIFFRGGFVLLQKNESVFCASAIEIQIIFCAVAVFFNYLFFAVACQLLVLSCRFS